MREEGILPIVDTLHHLLKIIIGNQNDARIKLYGILRREAAKYYFADFFR